MSGVHERLAVGGKCRNGHHLAEGDIYRSLRPSGVVKQECRHCRRQTWHRGRERQRLGLSGSRDVMIPAERLAPILLDWHAGDDHTWGVLPPTDIRRVHSIVSGECREVSLYVADRILCALRLAPDVWHTHLADLYETEGAAA